LYHLDVIHHPTCFEVQEIYHTGQCARSGFQEHCEEELTQDGSEPTYKGTGAQEVRKYMGTSLWEIVETVYGRGGRGISP
jgi:hypothetical protein